MNCQVCGRRVSGDLNVTAESLEGGVIVTISATPDRDWICCDACNALVCEDCCMHPESGYCDSCIASRALFSYLVETGIIKDG